MWLPKKKTKCSILILRHGESENNVLDIECADIENKDCYALTSAGRRQIELAVNEEHKIDTILSSPLRRAMESAEIAQSRYGSPIHVEELLIEQNVGKFEMRPESERRNWKAENGSSCYPGGESPQEVEVRVKNLLESLDSKYSSQRVLLVTHTMFLLCFFRHFCHDFDWDLIYKTYIGPRRILDLNNPSLST